jgi:hypothetical protein
LLRTTGRVSVRDGMGWREKEETNLPEGFQLSFLVLCVLDWFDMGPGCRVSNQTIRCKLRVHSVEQ